MSKESRLSLVQHRQALVEASRRVVALGMNAGAAGNLSVRLEDGGFLITPSGVRPSDMTAEQMVEMTLAGEVCSELRPSSEWQMHRDILAARPEDGAVIHTHAPFCTALAVHGLRIPPFHYMISVLGGEDVRCAPYHLFGTADLSHACLTAMEGRKGCLLAHHGMVVAGRDLAQALNLAIELETLAESYWRARQLGEPPHLNAEQMAAVFEKFRTSYGPRT